MLFRILKFLKRKIVFILFLWPSIIKFRVLSTCSNIEGKARYNQAVQANGNGKIIFGKNVKLGCNPSPYLYTGSIYIEARNQISKIEFQDNVWVNNGCIFIAEGEGILIGANSLIGTCCEFIDSDFHDLHPHNRLTGSPAVKPVTIGKNVFIGNNVKILKGVSIGNNSVVANGSVVTKSIPENVIAGGSPARIIKGIEEL